MNSLDITNDTGFEFWNDLVKDYGLVEASIITENYLACPLPKCGAAAKEEINSRKELWQAMKEVPNYQRFYNLPKQLY